MTSYRTGLNAEFLARLVLRMKGYSILVSRYRSPFGEIDIIARRGNTLAMIEVKRREDVLSSSEAISVRQQKRIRDGASFFLGHNPRYQGFFVRFDALLVFRRFFFQHIENAF